MSAHPSNPNPQTAFPRLSKGHEIPAPPQHDTSIPSPRISANSDPVAHPPGRAFSPAPSSPSPNPELPLRDLRALRGSTDESLPSFSAWLEHEFQDPTRAHLLAHASARSNPSDLELERKHEREFSYRDRGTPPPRANLPLFDPPPEETEVILREIADPSLTYSDIAGRHSTTFDALCLWLARPDIAERFRAMRSAAARRAHFVVADNLANIAQILVNTLRSSSDAHEHSGYLPKTTRGFIAHLRSRDDIRKSANLLLRIARFDFASQAPLLREGIGGRENSETPSLMGARAGGGRPLASDLPAALEVRRASEAPSLREGVGGREESETHSRIEATVGGGPSEAPSLREGVGGGCDDASDPPFAPIVETDFVPHPNRPERARNEVTGAVAPEPPDALEVRRASEAPSLREGVGGREDSPTSQSAPRFVSNPDHPVSAPAPPVAPVITSPEPISPTNASAQNSALVSTQPHASAPNTG